MPIPIPGRVADIVRQSVVQIRSGGSHSGSGVVLASEQIITNAHVVPVPETKIESWEGSVLSAKVVRIDRSRDLALLSVAGLKSAPLPLGDSDKVRAGTPVLAIGNPLGFVGAVSSGVIHATAGKWIRADVRLAPGNSGGPLVDFSGQVLGINTLIATGGLAYAVPSRSVQRFLLNSPQQRLGVIIRAVEFQPNRFGLLVLGLVPDSAATRASLLPGDVLTGADGNTFEHVDDLPVAIEKACQGVLQLEFYRGNYSALRQVAVNLLSAKEQAAA